MWCADALVGNRQSCCDHHSTQSASLGPSNSVGALEVRLKGRIGSVAAFDEAHGTVRVNVDYEANGDVWTHSQLVSDSHIDAEASAEIGIASVALLSLDDEPNDILYIWFTLYIIYPVYNLPCIWFTLYMIYSIYDLPYMWYTLYMIYPTYDWLYVWWTLCIIDFMCDILYV